jgi:hypothetical protein
MITVSGLKEGNYTITLNDGSSTLFTPREIPMIDGGNIPKFNLEVFKPSCFSYSNGLIRVKNPTGIFTTSPKIEWSDGSFNIDTISSLTNGRYSVTITDDNGCKSIKDTLLNTDTLRASYTVVKNAICRNSLDNINNGEIELKISGGTPFPSGGYTIAQAPSNTFLGPLTFPTSIPVKGGNSLFKIRDRGIDPYGRVVPCQVDLNVETPYRDSIKFLNTKIDPVKCKGQNNGAVEVTFSGTGNSEYRIIREWDEIKGSTVSPSGFMIARTSYVNRELKAGRYYVIVESTVGRCQDTFRYNINEAIIPLRVNQSTTQPSCATFGSIRLTAAGGQPPYKYRWSDGDSVANRTNLSPGAYRVTVIDFNKCDTIFNFNLVSTDNNKVAKTSVVKPVSCFNTNTGEVTVDLDSASYSWKNSAGVEVGNTKTISNLFPGKYFVTVTKDGCLSQDSISLANPPQIVIDSIIDSPPQCAKGGIKGSYRTVVNGSNGPYTIEWKNVSGGVIGTQISVSNLDAGNYTLTVKDKNSCSKDTMLSLKAPNPITINLISGPTQILCYGDSTGNAFVRASGGTIPNNTRFTFNWSNGRQSLGIFDRDVNNALGAGRNWVIASDGVCLSDTFFMDLIQRERITLSQITSGVCGTECNGSVKLIPSGGTGGIAIKLNNTVLQNDSIINLCVGKYPIIVEDALGCTLLDTINIAAGDPTKVGKASISKPITCFGTSTGELTVSLDSASYVWRNAAGIGAGITKTISNVPAGKYFVTVIKDGCTSKDSVILTSPEAIRIDSIQSIAPQCPRGGTKGSLGAIVSGGTPTYTYEWKDQTGAVIGTQSVRASLDVGNYTLTIKDKNNCTKDTALMLRAPNPILINTTGELTQVLCFGDSTGVANVEARGGTIIGNNNFKFIWSNGRQSNGLGNRDTNNKLTEGRNWVFAGDGVCLSDTLFIDLVQRQKITVNKSIVGLCGVECKGSVKLQASGGTNGLIILFNGNRLLSDSIGNLCRNNYPILISDGLGCTLRDTAVVGNNDSIKVSINKELTEDITCRVATGNIKINVVGGKPDYTYAWSAPITSTTSQAINLPAGSYTVTVTDANGCFSTLSYVLKAPDSVRAVIPQPEPPKCFGGGSCIKVTSVSGGIGTKYTMQINNGLRIPVDSCLELIEGKYLVSIFDEAGCKTNYNVNIPGAREIKVDLGENQSVSLGVDIEEIKPKITSALPIVKYEWSGIGSLTYKDSVTKTSIIGKPANNLIVFLKVTDENGCSANDFVAIEVTRARNVFIPNIFKLSASNTENKKFEITTGFGITEIEDLIILDRWGNAVYRKSNYLPDESSGWDGTLNGIALNPGVFVYSARIKFIDGEIKVYKGDVTLVK